MPAAPADFPESWKCQNLAMVQNLKNGPKSGLDWKQHKEKADGFNNESGHLAVAQKKKDPIVGIGAPPILARTLVGIGMFTGGAIWVLTHGYLWLPSCCLGGCQPSGSLGLVV